MKQLVFFWRFSDIVSRKSVGRLGTSNGVPRMRRVVMSQACFPSSEDEEAKEIGRGLYFACGIIVFIYRTLRNGRVTAN
jgi:hypothetical protein